MKGSATTWRKQAFWSPRKGLFVCQEIISVLTSEIILARWSEATVSQNRRRVHSAFNREKTQLLFDTLNTVSYTNTVCQFFIL